RGNARADAGIYFRLVWEVLFGPGIFQPLVNSTIRIDDAGHAISMYDYYNPSCDFLVGPLYSGGVTLPDPPCSAPLGNRGWVHGVPVPKGISISAGTP